MQWVATGMAMVMATIALLILTTTVITVTRIDTIVTGTIIVDHGVGPVIGDETRKRPLPMGHNSSPLAKRLISKPRMKGVSYPYFSATQPNDPPLLTFNFIVAENTI